VDPVRSESRIDCWRTDRAFPWDAPGARNGGGTWYGVGVSDSIGLATGGGRLPVPGAGAACAVTTGVLVQAGPVYLGGPDLFTFVLVRGRQFGHRFPRAVIGVNHDVAVREGLVTRAQAATASAPSSTRSPEQVTRWNVRSSTPNGPVFHVPMHGS
jgi:hypothetical protein